MHFVVLGIHSPEVCPTSNSKTRELMLQMGPEVPKVAERAGVKLVAGPYVNREHTTVVIVEAATAEALDRFLVESRLPQWNTIRIIPSVPIEEAMQEVQAQPAIF